MGVGSLKVFIFCVCKNGLQKICKIFAFELGFMLGVMRGFQNGITLGGRASGSFHILGLQKLDCCCLCYSWFSRAGLDWYSGGIQDGVWKDDEDWEYKVQLSNSTTL